MRWTFFQLMECQPTAVLEAAPADVSTADLSASPPWVGWPRFSRGGTLQGSLPAMSQTFNGSLLVGRLFAWKRCCWWDQLIFYPAHYRPAFACSLIPDPPPHRRILRTRSPPQWCMRKEDCGPGHPKGRVHQHDQQGEGRASEPVVQHPWQESACLLHLTTYRFGSSLAAAFVSIPGLSNITARSRHFSWF